MFLKNLSNHGWKKNAEGKSKIKVATSSKFSDPKKKKDYSKMADWEGETNKELNRLN